MIENTFQTLWQDPAWLAETRAWIDSQLRAHNLRATGAIETMQTRPWSLMMRVPTDTGALYFKAIAPTWKFEAALTTALAKWSPQNIPELVAADETRGWLLMRDSGARFALPKFRARSSGIAKCK